MSNSNSPNDPFSRPDTPTQAHRPIVPQVASNVAPGQLLLNRYELLERIGAGGMGEVWKARDRQLDRVVAIKRIKPELASQQSLLDRFFQEAKAVAALNHPHIVQIYDRGTDASGEFFVMEYVDGPSLARLLAEHGAFDVERTVRIGKAMCDALQAAHDKGILHRDVKPGNILLAPGDVPKLTDFGLARLESVGDHMLTMGSVGTPIYMAPEQQESPNCVTFASDQWSFAATLYHIVTGQAPRVIRENRLPESIRAVLMRALDEQPTLRFPNLTSFAQSLAAASGLIDQTTMATDVGLEGLAESLKRQQRQQEDAEHTLRQVERLRAEHQYRPAAELLETIPEELRDSSLLDELKSVSTRVERLSNQIHDALASHHRKYLPYVVDELLDIVPNHPEVLTVRSALNNKGTARYSDLFRSLQAAKKNGSLENERDQINRLFPDSRLSRFVENAVVTIDANKYVEWYTDDLGIAVAFGFAVGLFSYGFSHLDKRDDGSAFLTGVIVALPFGLLWHWLKHLVLTQRAARNLVKELHGQNEPVDKYFSQYFQWTWSGVALKESWVINETISSSPNNTLR